MCQSGFVESWREIEADESAIFSTCEDIDECKSKDACHPMASCENLAGSYSCDCRDGYEGDSFGLKISVHKTSVQKIAF